MPEPLPTWNTASHTALRVFARIRLLALDVDGTLLHRNRGAVFLTIKKLANSTLLRPVHIVIATGRTLRGVAPVLEQWPLASNGPVILYNGSVVVHPRNNRVTLNRTIPLTAVAAILQLCRTHGRPLLAYVYRPNPVPTHDCHPEEVYGWSQRWRPTRDLNDLPIRWQSSWQYSDLMAPTALLIKTPTTNSAAFAEQVRRTGAIDLTSSGGHFLELRPHGSSKAAALSSVAAGFRLHTTQVLAMGDNDNDADMLRWAGTGVAVAAASRRALSNADYVCRYGVSRGVVEILRLIRSARRYHQHALHGDTVGDRVDATRVD